MRFPVVMPLTGTIQYTWAGSFKSWYSGARTCTMVRWTRVPLSHQGSDTWPHSSPLYRTYGFELIAARHRQATRIRSPFPPPISPVSRRCIDARVSAMPRVFSNVANPRLDETFRSELRGCAEISDFLSIDARKNCFLFFFSIVPSGQGFGFTLISR